MDYRELTAEEINRIPAEFYSDVDKMRMGGRYRPGMLGSIIGAFDRGRMVGLWVVPVLVHCGPIWIDPALRGQSAEARAGMWEKVREVVHGLGARQALMVAMDDAPAVRAIIKKLPSRAVPGQLFVVEV